VVFSAPFNKDNCAIFALSHVTISLPVFLGNFLHLLLCAREILTSPLYVRVFALNKNGRTCMMPLNEFKTQYFQGLSTVLKIEYNNQGIIGVRDLNFNFISQLDCITIQVSIVSMEQCTK
jgi:hypothetical protein